MTRISAHKAAGDDQIRQGTLQPQTKLNTSPNTQLPLLTPTMVLDVQTPPGCSFARLSLLFTQSLQMKQTAPVSAAFQSGQTRWSSHENMPADPEQCQLGRVATPGLVSYQLLSHWCLRWRTGGVYWGFRTHCGGWTPQQRPGSIEPAVANWVW